MTRWVGLVVVVLAVVGCATTWEGVKARVMRETFETCRRETGETEARITWMAPDGIFRLWTPTTEAMQRMQSCMTDVAGVSWPK